MKQLILFTLMAIAVGGCKEKCKQIEIITNNDIYIDFQSGDTIKTIRHRPQFGVTVEQWNYVSEQLYTTEIDVLGDSENGYFTTTYVWKYNNIYWSNHSKKRFPLDSLSVEKIKCQLLANKAIEQLKINDSISSIINK